MTDRDVRIRTALGLAGIALALLALPLLVNIMRGGAEGVGYDPRTQGSGLRFAVTYPATVSPGPLRGRLVLVVSMEPPVWPLKEDPGPGWPYLFWRDVTSWSPGRPIELTDAHVGKQLPSIAHIPPAHYWVQGIFEATATAGEAPPSGWSPRPGDLLSRPVEVYVDPRSADVIRVDLARTVALPSP